MPAYFGVSISWFIEVTPMFQLNLHLPSSILEGRKILKDKISHKLIALNQKYRIPRGPVAVTNKSRTFVLNIFGSPARNVSRHTSVVYNSQLAPRLCGKFAIP
jgi:hypothetical protein